MTALLIWSLAAALPFGGAWVRLQIAAYNAIPVYPQSRIVKKNIEFGDYENHGDRMNIKFVAQAGLSDILDFYKKELTAKGYKEGPEHFIEWKSDGTPYWFKHNKNYRTLHIKIEPKKSEQNIVYIVFVDL